MVANARKMKSYRLALEMIADITGLTSLYFTYALENTDFFLMQLFLCGIFFNKLNPLLYWCTQSVMFFFVNLRGRGTGQKE